MERVVVTSFGLEQDVKVHMRIPPQVLTVGFLSLPAGLRPPLWAEPLAPAAGPVFEADRNSIRGTGLLTQETPLVPAPPAASWESSKKDLHFWEFLSPRLQIRRVNFSPTAPLPGLTLGRHNESCGRD